MSSLRVRMFGKLEVEQAGRRLDGLDARKAQELLAYLVLHRDRPHTREFLANLLWSDCESTQAKSYLRKALWQVQSALHSTTADDGSRPMHVDGETVQFIPTGSDWLDLAVFEAAFTLAQNIRGRDLDPARVDGLKLAVDVYHGELLEGWYLDWCLFERERLQRMYLIMLDKLMGNAEAQQQPEAGLAYGARILRCEVAHERTHRRLMRLYFQAGDRTAALRQYQWCAAVLDRELGVPPDRTTVALYEQIRANRLDPPPSEPSPERDDRAGSLRPALTRLKQMCRQLDELQQQVRREIQLIEGALDRS